MSRAFVKETAEGAAPPERMVSSGPNLVTEEGMAKIAREVERLETALAAESNVLLRETLERDLRYWRQSLATAQVVKRPLRRASHDTSPADAGEESEVIGFGATVTFTRNNGKPQTIRIVGEDEGDPKAGLINFRSPLARALIGGEAGDTVEMQSPRAQLTVLKVA